MICEQDLFDRLSVDLNPRNCGIKRCTSEVEQAWRARADEDDVVFDLLARYPVLEQRTGRIWRP